MNNKDADQPVHMYSLISFFVIHSLDSCYNSGTDKEGIWW